MRIRPFALTLMIPVLVLALASPALATATADTFPWTPVLQRIVDSLRGPVAHLLIMLAIVVSGFVFALVEMSYGMHRLIGVAFGGTIAIADSHFVCQGFDLSGETWEQQPAVYDDRGGVLCGCPEATERCLARSNALEPPPPIGGLE